MSGRVHGTGCAVTDGRPLATDGQPASVHTISSIIMVRTGASLGQEWYRICVLPSAAVTTEQWPEPVIGKLELPFVAVVVRMGGPSFVKGPVGDDDRATPT